MALFWEVEDTLGWDLVSRMRSAGVDSDCLIYLSSVPTCSFCPGVSWPPIPHSTTEHITLEANKSSFPEVASARYFGHGGEEGN